jgi:RNA polymerase sigma-70 factor (ECF subfamily)
MRSERATDLTDSLPALLRFARSLTRDAAAADDLVQDVMVRALERGSRFDGERSYQSWLLTMTHNLFIDGWRRQQVRDRHRVESVTLDRTEPSQEHAAILAETLRAFEGLSGEQRAIMHLVVIEGVSYADAANILGVAVGTVMSRLSRARQDLRSSTSSAPKTYVRLVSDRDG